MGGDSFQDVLSMLSEREREVLAHLAAGCTYGTIARRMGLSSHTVDTYIRRIRGKTGVANRVELTLLALAAGSHGKGGKVPSGTAKP
ncbi:helix-turn-helix transcriptional regulator [Streptomyces sp. MST-110588]|nr:helix-turn-helix transcriptional regulator [Streptomyces sp. MST-110588]